MRLFHTTQLPFSPLPLTKLSCLQDSFTFLFSLDSLRDPRKPGRVANITTVQEGHSKRMSEEHGGQGCTGASEGGAELARAPPAIWLESGLGKRDGAGWFVVQQEIWLRGGRRQTRCFDFILRPMGDP